jgi:hypothetical protein
MTIETTQIPSPMIMTSSNKNIGRGKGPPTTLGKLFLISQCKYEYVPVRSELVFYAYTRNFIPLHNAYLFYTAGKLIQSLPLTPLINACLSIHSIISSSNISVMPFTFHMHKPWKNNKQRRVTGFGSSKAIHRRFIGIS